MRGLAALVVVFHHFYLMFYRAHFRSNPLSVLIYPFVAGHESVMLFFVLSGFVLSLPLMKQVPFSYPIYVWKRVLRIYGPYLGALAIAIIGCAIWHNRVPSFAGGVPPWYGPVTLQGVSHALVFIGPKNDTRYNETFWSLIHEMRISIVFPVIFLFIGAIGIAGAALAIFVCTLIGVQWELQTVQFVGMFIIGILLAKHRFGLQTNFHKLGIFLKLSLFTGALALFYGSHAIKGVWWHLGDMPIAVAAAVLIVIALSSTKLTQLLSLSPIAFLGNISYSLYLIHMTVLCALTVVLSNRINGLEFFIVYVSGSILLSWGFYLVVEQPFMKLSRRAGTGIGKLQQKETSEVEAFQ
jgi:peptidoglycan/LPS O-acetylase OafA/YrhL